MSLLANLIGTAKNLVRSFGLDCDVRYYAYTGADGSGKAIYATGVTRKAIYTQQMKQVRTFSGEIAVSSGQIAFLDPTVVSPFDKIVTPVGGVLDLSDAAREAAQPIIGLGAFTDASNAGVLTEIYLG